MRKVEALPTTKIESSTEILQDNISNETTAIEKKINNCNHQTLFDMRTNASV